MKTEWFTDVSALEKLKAEWNELLQRSVIDTLFITHEWQTTWWRNLGNGELRIITLREDDGKLIGLAPLFAEQGSDGLIYLSLVGCVDVSDYLDLLVAQGCEERVYAALLDVLTRDDFPAWNSLGLCTLPEASPANTLLKTMAEARGLKVQHHLHDVSPMIELPDTWETYLATLDKKDRHEVRRKLRRVEEAGGRWYIIDSAAALDQATADFIELHKKSRPDKNLFMDMRMQKFFAETAQAMFAQGWLQLLFLEVDGERAAALWNFIYHNDVLVYNSGYDPVKYGALSPGNVLFSHSIQDAIDAKRRRYDFLRGNEDYKYRFGAKDTKVFELRIEKK
ncbi:MAG: GNAT family N-acetyltransferase [Chloroflexi bacterium]|nr:GNAT family N-acetyltransferase [Chloroflexota bacterium]